jgi:hypothetical protein
VRLLIRFGADIRCHSFEHLDMKSLHFRWLQIAFMITLFSKNLSEQSAGLSVLLVLFGTMGSRMDGHTHLPVVERNGG